MRGIFEHAIPLIFNRELFILAVVFVACVAAGHAAVYKRNSRAAFGWLGIILLSPLLAATIVVP